MAGETASLGEDLIAPEYHPHGLYLGYEARLNEKLDLYSEAGLAYEFSDSEYDYNFTLGAEYGIRDQLDLVIEGAFYSNGTGAGNNESKVLVGKIGLQGYF